MYCCCDQYFKLRQDSKWCQLTKYFNRLRNTLYKPFIQTFFVFTFQTFILRIIQKGFPVLIVRRDRGAGSGGDTGQQKVMMLIGHNLINRRELLPSASQIIFAPESRHYNLVNFRWEIIVNKDIQAFNRDQVKTMNVT